MFLRVENVHKSYGSQPILKDVSFAVDRGEFVSLVGPSGVGKTTLLKIVAGLETPSSGRLVFERPPSTAAPVILVFQDYILFPNLTVFDNVAFGLRVRKRQRQEIAQAVAAILAEFGLSDKTDYYPAQLSAGQKQRVALARALVIEPAMLLLDEPFANLDRNLRADTAEFLRSVQRKFAITTISVTHDLEEAFALSDRIGIMLNGTLMQFDTVEAVYHQPSTPEVARFLGPVNIIPRRLFALFGLGEAGENAGPPLQARPEALTMEKDAHGPGVVEGLRFAGGHFLYQVKVADRKFTVYSLSDGIKPGDAVRLRVKRSLPATSG